MQTLVLPRLRFTRDTKPTLHSLTIEYTDR